MGLDSSVLSAIQQGGGNPLAAISAPGTPAAGSPVPQGALDSKSALAAQMQTQAQQPGDVSAIDQGQTPDTATPGQVIAQMQPGQGMAGLNDALHEEYQGPDYFTTIDAVLQSIQKTVSAGQVIQLDAQAKAINEMCNAVFSLARAATESGQSIPGKVDVRIQAAQLNMQAQQQQHQQAMDIANAKMQALQAGNLNDAKIAQMVHDAVLKQQQQGHDQSLALDQQQHQQGLDTAQAAHQMALNEDAQAQQQQLAQQAQDAQQQAQQAGAQGGAVE